MTRLIKWMLVVVSSLSVVLVSGCNKAQEVRIYYTHSGAGFLEPCACLNELLGGMPRRASMLNKHRSMHEDAIVLDAGNFLKPDSLSRSNHLMLDLMMHDLKYDALNVSEYELTADLPFLYPCFSTNIRGRGELATSVLLSKGGLRILVLGVTAPSALTVLDASVQASLHVETPIESVRKVISEQQADVIIVLVHSLDYSLEKEIARTFPSVSAIISTTIGSEAKAEPVFEGSTPIVGMIDGSQGLGELILNFDGGSRKTSFGSHKVMLLNDSIPDDTAIRAKITAFGSVK